MEQTKEIIQNNTISIQKQIEGLESLLKKVLIIDAKNATCIKSLSKKEMHQYATYVQNVNTYQCTVLKKLCEIIIDFETLYEEVPLGPASLDISRNSSRLSNGENNCMELKVIKQYVENIKHNNSFSNDEITKISNDKECIYLEDLKPKSEWNYFGVVYPKSEYTDSEYTESVISLENSPKHVKPDVTERIREEAVTKSAAKGSIFHKLKTTKTWQNGEETEDFVVLPELSFKPTGKLTSTLSDSDGFSVSIDRFKMSTNKKQTSQQFLSKSVVFKLLVCQ